MAMQDLRSDKTIIIKEADKGSAVEVCHVVTLSSC